ncbi:MAG: hypothetical protein ACI4ST_07360 [Candidatus Gallimonas sp.]
MKYQPYAGRRGSAKFLLAVLAAFLCTLCLFAGIFWWSGRDYARVTFDETYYFLVRDCEDTTASAVSGQVYFSGGAGYLLERENAVVIACYFRESSANQVRDTLALKGVEARVLSLSPPDLELSGELAAQKARISSNAETLDSCAHILYDTANGLERTEISQDEARSALRGVIASLKGLCAENGEGFSRWNAVVSQAVRKGTEIAEGILFARDLRYLQAQICMNVVRIGDYFG